MLPKSKLQIWRNKKFLKIDKSCSFPWLFAQIFIFHEAIWSELTQFRVLWVKFAMEICAWKRLISTFHNRCQESRSYKPENARDHPKFKECVYTRSLGVRAVNENADGFANVFFALLWLRRSKTGLYDHIAFWLHLCPVNGRTPPSLSF